MKVSRNWLQTYFEKALPEGEELAELLTMHAFEVEGVEHIDVNNDVIIDVDILANRSSDCLSHRGIAREVATLLAVPMKVDPLRASLPVWDKPENFTSAIGDTSGCMRHMGAVVRGVTVGPSPEWLKGRLHSLGQRSINNVVDATNFVMYNLGQPVHVFDLDKIAVDESGARSIAVTKARDNEQIALLDGKEYKLSESNLVIRDMVSGKALDIAGIKGGMEAELSQETANIVIDCASFDPVSIRKTSRSLRIATDASVRFQNEPARELPAFAIRDTIELIRDIAGGTLVGVYDTCGRLRERMPVDVTLHDINTLLGTELSYDDVEQILVRFDWEFSRSRDEFAITSPWERTDLTCREAFVEEIGRVYGYRNITAVLPEAFAQSPNVNRTQYYTDMLRRMLLKRGYSEVLTYTLRDRGEVALENPFASDKSLLRMSLRDGLSDALTVNAGNAALLGLENVKVFEIGTVWSERGEDLAIALGVRAVHGKQGVLENELVDDLSAITAALSTDGRDVPVTTADGIAEMILDPYLLLLPRQSSYGTTLPWNTDARFTMWSRYPYVVRDIAVWVPRDVPPEEVLAIILEKAPDILVRHDQFDVFEKDGRTSYAWHLVFQSDERTLVDEEVGNGMDTITKALSRKKGWEVR